MKYQQRRIQTAKNTGTNKAKPLGISVDAADLAQLRLYAEQTGLSVSAIIRMAINVGIKSADFTAAVRSVSSPFTR